MTFTTLCRLLSQAVIHSRQPVALNWARNSFGLVLTVSLRKICILGIAEYFLIVLFQISEIKKDEIRFKKYIFLLDMFLIVGGEGSSNRNASRDESVEAGDKSVEAGDESIEAGEKTPQSCYNEWWKWCDGLLLLSHLWISNSHGKLETSKYCADQLQVVLLNRGQ